MIFHLRDWSIMFQDFLIIFLFFQANWIGGNRRSLWTRSSSLWMQNPSFFAPSSQSHRRHPPVRVGNHWCRRWTLFTMNTWVHFTTSPGGCKTFACCIFYFIFFFSQGLKNILLSTLKTLHSLSPQKEILTKKKKPFLNPLPAASRRRTSAPAIDSLFFPAGRPTGRRTIT